MFKLLNDNFVINEIVGSNSTEALLENEIHISGDMPNIEKIISTEGKVKLNSISVLTNKIAVHGELVYNVIYRSNDTEDAVSATSGKIDFMEEISVPGVTDKMEASLNAYIDYIDSQMISDDKFLLKSVVNIDADVFNNHSVNFISSLESDGTFQAKTKTIEYTDIVSDTSTDLNINNQIILNDGAYEISKILKTDVDAYITSTDIMNDRMLVEGICRLGFLYSEDNNMSTVNYIAEDFPFTHYLEVKNLKDDMPMEMKITLNNITYDLSEGNNKENKIINFDADFTVNAKLYDSLEKNLIVDGYSTISDIDITSSKVFLSSTKKLKQSVTKYENNFDVISGTIKDIYTVDISPKISEKRIFDDKYIIDGFLDVNLLYLNGDVNKLDRAYASMPFTTTFALDDEDKNYSLDSNLTVKRCSAYRKGINSVLVNCDIAADIKLKNSEDISIISDITDLGPLNQANTPSLIFRVVQSGETLWDIGKNYNVSLNYLKELNSLPNDDKLAAGSKIIIARKV